MGRFEQCMPVTMGAEVGGSKNGGYSNRRADHGGATRWGITEAEARANGWQGDMRELPESLAVLIYRMRYWNLVHADNVPQPADLVIFDTAVQEGVNEAMKQLQRAVGQTADGIWGEHTAAAVSFANGKSLAIKLLDVREEYYRDIVRREPEEGEFLKGWLDRLNHLRGLL